MTGGRGGLGLLFAEHMAGKYGANLILTGRSPLNDEKQTRIGKLEKLGGRVIYVQADVCDTLRMTESLGAARERFGPIHGVIHAAGVTGPHTILDKDPSDFQATLAPKIEGTLALDACIQEDPLDFICYFSSTSAVLGDFGACDYAVGNRFEMAYAQDRNKRGLSGRTVVIHWPLWKDGGMGFSDSENTKMYLKSSGQRLLEADEGLEAFERILSGGSTQYLVLAGLPSRVHRFLGLADLADHAHDVSASVPEPLDGNVLSVPAGKGWRAEMKGMDLEQCLEWDLKEQIGGMLKIPREKLDLEDNLADFGFDSIRLAEFASLLSGHYGMEITPSLFFGYSTIAKLIRYFAGEHGELLKAFYRESPEERTVSPSTSGSPAALSLSGARKSEWKAYRKSKAAEAEPEHEPIAIIGMSGRFPEARTIDEMWSILAEGNSAVKEVPESRFDWRRYVRDGEDQSDRIHCRWSGTVPGVSEFDPMFFEIPPKEAETMDPRQRLLLQEAWRALEDAGYGADRLQSGKIGMFVGVEDGDYHLLVKDKGTITSTHSAILAARLSYFLNLSGPNMAINTACSSGLVAVHQACMSLRSGESDTAIAAAVNLLLTPDAYMGISRAGILSEDGKCYAFDERANGTVPGKRLSPWCSSGSRRRKRTGTRSMRSSAEAASITTAKRTVLPPRAG
ncbi:SDR family NAD(P)-dependent oxidoreductase [Paenibacillus sp. P26]|nr:SDR family NAD(P)-dependent oxidoreductase [Paenibacillus sp. P26]